MTDVVDAAEYVLSRTGYVSTMKLQKLVFYADALSLVRTSRPLFPEDFQAGVNGPVCPELFRAHRGRFIVGPGELRAQTDVSLPSVEERSLLDQTVAKLGHLDGEQLSSLTHSERPWRDARSGCGVEDRCSAVISPDSIRGYYSSPCCPNPLFSAT